MKGKILNDKQRMDHLVNAVLNDRNYRTVTTEVRVTKGFTDVYHYGNKIFTKSDKGYGICFCGELYETIFERLNALTFGLGFSMRFMKKGKKVYAEGRGYKIKLDLKITYSLPALYFHLALADNQ